MNQAPVGRAAAHCVVTNERIAVGPHIHGLTAIGQRKGPGSSFGLDKLKAAARSCRLCAAVGDENTMISFNRAADAQFVALP
ncbi:hypothetical protein D9M68_977480 [compost metagenome]